MTFRCEIQVFAEGGGDNGDWRTCGELAEGGLRLREEARPRLICGKHMRTLPRTFVMSLEAALVELVLSG